MRMVVDWDGTVTETDVLDVVLLEFGDPEVYERYEARLGRDLTLHDVIAGEFRTVRAPLDEVVTWVRENVALRDGFLEFARRHEPVVVSSGFHEFIEPVLDREGLRLEVLANRVDARPEGWQVVFRDEAACSVCGEPCKRSVTAALRPFVFVGDGFSDHCVAEAASRVFARDGLSDYLAAREVAFERFEDFRDVERLLGSAA